MSASLRHCFHMRVLQAVTAALLLCAARAPCAPTLPALPRAGVCAMIGLPAGDNGGGIVACATQCAATFYVQVSDGAQADAIRKALHAAGLLGTRVFVDRGDPRRIHLADNVADTAVVPPNARDAVYVRELLRVVRPRGAVVIGTNILVKPAPEGMDDWSHPCHAPDNNPRSRDQAARAPYSLQFLAEPMFCPMPELTVAAGGRVFKLFGHLAFRASQNAVINTLMAFNGYNGAVLWSIPLNPGFMIHRNTIAASADALFYGDDRSCRVFDPETGAVRREIVLPDTPVWKWIAIEGTSLYALVGGAERRVGVERATLGGLAHWSWNAPGRITYDNPASNPGFGRRLAALDPATGAIIWERRFEPYVDGRAVCMSNGRLFFFCPGVMLGCIDATTGALLWTNATAQLLDAVGADIADQNPHTGFSPQPYLMCNDRIALFAGAQRRGMTAVDARTGSFLWHTADVTGVVFPVLFDENICAVTTGDRLGSGPKSGWRSYESGALISRLPNRWNCVRVTASIDSIFSRGVWGAGTWRYDVSTGSTDFLSPMRPACQDGVVTANGLLYWGPWMCGACNISLYGHIALCSAPTNMPAARPQLESTGVTPASPARRVASSNDWPCYLGDNARSGAVRAAVPARVVRSWSARLRGNAVLTAPVAAGGAVFLGDSLGCITALDASNGAVAWTAYTGGAVNYPPAVEDGIAYAGSADGWVYALDAADGAVRWRFRAAPDERWIPVYGTLASTWPVAGGVAVEDGVVFAAAGIADFAGTFVVALDAARGTPVWRNASSGALCKEGGCGISLQGPLSLAHGFLSFAGGTVYETAVFDAKTGRCTNTPIARAAAAYRTVFDPYVGKYAGPAPVERPRADGSVLVANQRQGLALLQPADGGAHPRADATGTRRTVWSQPSLKPDAVIAGRKMAIVGMTARTRTGEASSIAAVRITDGSLVWQETLPAKVVTDGLAVDARSRIFAVLVNGEVLCWSPAR